MLEQFRRAEIDLDAVALALQREGAEAFAKSWNELPSAIVEKTATLRNAH